MEREGVTLVAVRPGGWELHDDGDGVGHIEHQGQRFAPGPFQALLARGYWRAPMLKYSPDQPRDDQGQWSSGGVLPVDAAEETYRGAAVDALAEHLQGRELGSQEDLGVGTERYIQAAFSGPLPGGVESVARDAALNPATGTYSVMVDFFDEDGEKVGQASRHINPSTGRVEHAAMTLAEEVQGQDIAQEFNARAEAFYSEAGLTEVGLYANSTVGGYAWATQGYDWDFNAGAINGATTENQVAHIAWELTGVAMGALWSDAFASGRALPPLSKDTLAAAADLVERFQLPHDDPNFPKPIEVAALGVWDAPVTEEGWHLGKAILMGGKWNAVKQL